jgi:DNA invertase Pin-like site-specific DNA recombinase
MTKEEKQKRNDQILLAYQALERAKHPRPAQEVARKFNIDRVTVWRAKEEAIRRNTR